jgi:ADP-heptose:LPS heptosyltransferase
MRRPRILVHSIGNLGDTIASVPALRLIRKKYGPETKIWLFYDWSPKEVVSAKQVLLGAGIVDDFIHYERVSGLLPNALAAFRAWWRIAVRRFDTVIYLMQSERSEKGVRRDRIFFSLCGIPEKLGFVAFSKQFLYPRDTNGVPLAVEHEAVRRAKRLRAFGFAELAEHELDDPFLHVPEQDESQARVWLAENRRHPERILVAFCPASKMTAKIWPEERFVEIGRRLLADGRFEIVVVGGPADKALGASLLRQWGSGIEATGSFSVLGSAALLRECKFSVTVDSGPMHLAAAVGTPCLALFSGIDYPGRFHPLGRGHVLLRHSVPCAGCRLQACAVEGHPCMTGIGLEEVWQGVRRLCVSLQLIPPEVIQPVVRTLFFNA